LEQIVKLTNCRYTEDSREMGNSLCKFIKDCDTIIRRFFIKNCANYFLLSQGNRILLRPFTFFLCLFYISYSIFLC